MGYPKSLSEEEQHQVVRWLGEFVPPMRIPALIKQRFGKKVNDEFAYVYLKTKKWTVLIDRYRQQYLIKLDVPEAFRKVRLEKIHRRIERLEAMELKTPLESYERRMLRLLDAARLEMQEPKEGDRNFFFNHVQVQGRSEEELLRERAELAKRIQAFRWPTMRRIDHGSTIDVLSPELRSDGFQTGTGLEDPGGDSPARESLGNGAE